MNEALIDMFKFFPRKDLDHFTLVSGLWHSLINTYGQQLSIREINIHFNRDVRDSIVLKSGEKEVSFRYASILKYPEILKKAVENSKIVNVKANIYPRYWESRLKQMCNVFEEPVQIRKFELEAYGNCRLEDFIRVFSERFLADQLTLQMDPILFTDLISGQHYLPTLNFGPNTKEINFEVTGSDENWVYFDGNMERFITGRMFEWSSRINELSIDVHKDNLMSESEDMFGCLLGSEQPEKCIKSIQLMVASDNGFRNEFDQIIEFAMALDMQPMDPDLHELYKVHPRGDFIVEWYYNEESVSVVLQELKKKQT